MTPPDVRRQIEALRKAAVERAARGAESPFSLGERKTLEAVLRILDEHDAVERRERAADFAERNEVGAGQRCAETAWALRETKNTY